MASTPAPNPAASCAARRGRGRGSPCVLECGDLSPLSPGRLVGQARTLAESQRDSISPRAGAKRLPGKRFRKNLPSPERETEKLPKSGAPEIAFAVVAMIQREILGPIARL